MSQDFEVNNIQHKNKKALFYALIITFCIGLLYFIFASKHFYKFSGAKEQIEEISNNFKNPNNDIKTGIEKSKDLIEKTKFNNN